MYERIFEQTERLFRPWSEIWALQAEAAETLAKKQTTLMTDVWNQSVVALQSIPNQKNMEDVFKLQQEYWENLNGCVREMMEDTQGLLMETNQKISAVLHNSAPEPVNEMMNKAAESVPAKVMAASAKKAVQAGKKAAAAPTKAAAATTKAASSLPSKVAPSVAGAIQSKASEAAKPVAAAVKPAEMKTEIKADAAKPSAESAGGKSDTAS